MSFVAVVDLRLDSKISQGVDTAYAEKEFLLETVLPVAAVEVVGHLTVLFDIGLIVCVEKVEVSAADCDLPYSCNDVPAREGYAGRNPVALRVEDRLRRNPGEVLGIVAGDLLALTGDGLGEVTVSVEKTDSDKVDVHVRSLLQIVSRQKAETSGIDLERSVKAVFHAEICYEGILALRFESHIFIEFIQDRLEIAEENLVLGQRLEFLERNNVKQSNGIMVRLLPDFRVDRFEK